MPELDPEQQQILSTLNRFVEREVKPVASEWSIATNTPTPWSSG